jgi:hypothetical protein
MTKFHAIKTEIDGITFASRKEARRYSELRLLERAKAISGLELQPVYRLEVNGTLICKYLPDFRYIQDGKLVVEDVKSDPTKTPVYRIKKKLLAALFGIDVQEI